MDQEDELVALYGDISTEIPGEKEKPSTKEKDMKVKEDELGDDDESLFLQLYGDEAPVAEEIVVKKKFDPYEAAAVEVRKGLAQEDALATGTVGQTEASGERGEGAEANENGESSEEDDLMITLDENAAAYEPLQRNEGAIQGTEGAIKEQAIGAAPGEIMDDGSAAVTSIPGLGGFGSRTAIGGIPRSAIPGLGGSYAVAQSTPIPGVVKEGEAETSVQNEEVAGGTGKQIDGAAIAAAIAHPKPSSRHLRPEDAVFPSQWHPGLPMKLPGQTRVSPEEYKEFLNLGHGDIFDVDLDAVIEAPWKLPGIDPGDFFNYGMNEKTYREYQNRIKQFRLEFTMKSQIQTMDQAGPGAAHEKLSGTIVDGHTAAGVQEEEVDVEGDRALQSTMAESRDEHYEAFVTSERPPRTHWTRYSQPSDHTIVLTGKEIVFEPEKQKPPVVRSQTQYPRQPQHMLQQVQHSIMAPRPHIRPPPPPVISSGPSEEIPEQIAIDNASPSQRKGMPSLPPPFISSDDVSQGKTSKDQGRNTQLPPPFFSGSEDYFNGQYFEDATGNVGTQQQVYPSDTTDFVGGYASQSYAQFQGMPMPAPYYTDLGAGFDATADLAMGMEEDPSLYDSRMPSGRGTGRGRGRGRARGSNFRDVNYDAPRYDRRGNGRGRYDDGHRRGPNESMDSEGNVDTYRGDRDSSRTHRSNYGDSRRREAYDRHSRHRSRSPSDRKRRRSPSRSPVRRERGYKRERNGRR